MSTAQDSRCAFVHPPESIRCVRSAVRGSAACTDHKHRMQDSYSGPTSDSNPLLALAGALATADGYSHAEWDDPENANMRVDRLSTADTVLGELRRAGYMLVPDEPDHVLELRDDGWTLQHSLACRLSGQLFDCQVNAAVSYEMAASAPRERGRFLVTVVDDWLVLGEPVAASRSGAPAGGAA